MEAKMKHMIKWQINVKEMKLDEINETLTKIITDTGVKLINKKII